MVYQLQEHELPSSTHNCTCDRKKGVFLARVLANQPICREHYRLTLTVAEFPAAVPGQFIQIMCTEPSELGWSGGAFIRRPFSIGGLRCTGSGIEVDVLYRAIGIGTKWLSRLQSGENVSILGPLGQPFRHPAADKLAILVGGGIGLPPLIWLAERLHAAGTPAVAFCGARSADLLPLSRDAQVPCSAEEPTPLCPELARSATPALVATDDGSLGAHGLLPDVLSAWLDRNPTQAQKAVVYTCGPDRMMKAVAKLCIARNIPCQVCLERMMACGMGTCQSCVVRIRDNAAPEGWRYRLCCTDGPVFDAADVIWG